jgi:hypothetical protein
MLCVAVTELFQFRTPNHPVHIICLLSSIRSGHSTILSFTMALRNAVASESQLRPRVLAGLLVLAWLCLTIVVRQFIRCCAGDHVLLGID